MDPMNNNSDAGIPGAIVSPNEPAMPVGGGVGASRAADSGDIVLAPSGKTSVGGRKGLVAFLMVLALAAIVGVTLWMVWPKGDGDAGARDDFNKYANYILYGEQKSDNVEDFDPYSEYTIDEEYNNEDYLDTAMISYRRFYDDESEQPTAILSGMSLSNTLQYLNFLIAYDDVQLIDPDEIKTLVIEQGKDAAIEYAQTYFGTYDDLDVDDENGIIIEYEQYDVRKSIIEANYWQVYKDAGCLVGNTFDEKCMDGLSGDTINEYASQLGEVNTTMEGMVFVAVDNIKRECAEINDAFNGKRVFDEEDDDDGEVNDEE
ncbi:hypothetical protein IJH06_00910 [Candidatus Saccharibacteria bacterium]|nr:hypothetical protein [Candidatus Saccharibacteria bacterium]